MSTPGERLVLATPSPARGAVGFVPFARGYRPFFALAGIYGAGFIALWLTVLRGVLPAPAWLDPFLWHGHEMVFGFASAAIAGFLLTASPVWTGVTPVTGRRLAALAGLWLAGRVAMLAAGVLPNAAVAAVDLVFLPALGVALAPALLGPGRRRHGVFLLVLAALTLANVLAHAQALGRGVVDARAVLRGTVELVALLVVVIGGRITPAFTRNALGPEARVRATPRLDVVAPAAVALAALSGLVAPLAPLRSAAALVAGAAVLARLVGWQGTHARARRDPLLWGLHMGQLWLGVGLLAAGVGAVAPGLVPPFVSLHALGAGVIGGTILAVMPRVTLGHGGRPLVALAGTGLALGAVHAGAALRVFGPWLAPSATAGWWLAGGALWSAAFAFFVVRYGPLLLRPRADGRPG